MQTPPEEWRKKIEARIAAHLQNGAVVAQFRPGRGAADEWYLFHDAKTLFSFQTTYMTDGGSLGLFTGENAQRVAKIFNPKVWPADPRVGEDGDEAAEE